MLWDSPLTPVLERRYGPLGITPAMVVGLVLGRPPPGDSAFLASGLDWTPLLRSLVSGELDADRMDYLLRDSFYTGVNYGRYDLEWITQNLSPAEKDGQAVLGLSRAAVFAFEDFLLSRYHMFLSVYYHHTSVSFDHMLKRFYDEARGEFEVPSDMEQFVGCDDVALITALRASKNEWAQRIVTRRGYKRVAQFTERDEAYDLKALSAALTEAGIEHFEVESHGTLSRYFRAGGAPSLYVVDEGTGRLTDVATYTPLYERFDQGVKLFRIYVKPERADDARAIVAKVTQGRGVPHE
jgi:HD superfamily phosphohydrolase